MPTGKVKFYDAEKGFGFLAKDEGGDVYVHSSALPGDVETLKSGQRVEFGVAEGRRGEQALSVRVLNPAPSVAAAHAAASRKKPDEMVTIIEDLIRLLDGMSNTYRQGRRPDKKAASKVASVLRGVANDLEA